MKFFDQKICKNLFTLTSTGKGAVILPRCAIGVDGPTEIDDERCILCDLCTVKSTVGEAEIKRKNRIKNNFFYILGKRGHSQFINSKTMNDTSKMR